MTKRTKIFCLSLFFIVLASVGGELFARFWLGLGTPPLSIAHPSIEYLFKPNQDIKRFGNRIFINAYGMRSPDFSVRKSNPEERRILVFGDSVINGGNLTDQDRLATFHVERDLRKAWSIPVVVGNVSAGSWGPGNWLAYVKTFGFFDADVVILVISSHDTRDNPTFAPLNPNTHPTERPWSALGEGLTRYMPRYLPGLFPDMEEPSRPVVDADSSAEEQGLADLREFLRMANSQATMVAVFLWPEQEELVAGAPKAGWGHVQSICGELSITCVSLWSDLKRSLASGAKPYRDNIHPNDAGQELIAGAITSYLKPWNR